MSQRFLVSSVAAWAVARALAVQEDSRTKFLDDVRELTEAGS